MILFLRLSGFKIVPSGVLFVLHTKIITKYLSFAKNTKCLFFHAKTTYR